MTKIRWEEWVKGHLKNEVEETGVCEHKQLSVSSDGREDSFYAECTVCGAKLRVSTKDYSVIGEVEDETQG